MIYLMMVYTTRKAFYKVEIDFSHPLWMMMNLSIINILFFSFFRNLSQYQGSKEEQKKFDTTTEVYYLQSFKVFNRFDLPKVTCYVIFSTKKNCTWVPHKLQKLLRFRILHLKKIFKKSQNMSEEKA